MDIEEVEAYLIDKKGIEKDYTAWLTNQVMSKQLYRDK